MLARAVVVQVAMIFSVAGGPSPDLRSPEGAVVKLAAGGDSGQVDPEGAEWGRVHPRVMAYIRTISFKPRLFTREFRTCIGQFIGQPGTLEGTVLACVGFEEQRQREEVEKAAQNRVLEQMKMQAQEAEARALEAKENEDERKRRLEEHQPEAIKKWLGAVLGYRVALAEDSREDAKKEIAKQKKYSRYGGVVNKVVMYESQQKIRVADEEIERLRQMAKEYGVQVAGRKQKALSFAEDCVQDNKLEGEDCQDVRTLYQQSEPPADDE